MSAPTIEALEAEVRHRGDEVERAERIYRAVHHVWDELSSAERPETRGLAAALTTAEEEAIETILLWHTSVRELRRAIEAAAGVATRGRGR